MILTVTLNAALDITYVVDELVPHASHRVSHRHGRAGGKGVNVARVLHQMGHDATATGLVGHITGEQIRADLDDAGIRHAFVELASGESRSTLTVVDAASGEATVFNESGPVVTAGAWEQFTKEFVALAADADFVVISGSVPPGVPDSAYGELCAATPTPCLVDAYGSQLVAAARAGALVKPNNHELTATTGHNDPLQGALALKELGASAVVVSLGADGILAVSDEGAWRARPPEMLKGNPTGAGDAAAAAVAAGFAEAWPVRLREAVAWSAAAVPVRVAGELDIPTLERIRPNVVVEEMATDATDHHR